MNGLYMLANSNKEMEIKGDKQLIDLTSSVEFLTNELINSLQIEVSSPKDEVENLEKKADDQEQ